MELHNTNTTSNTKFLSLLLLVLRSFFIRNAARNSPSIKERTEKRRKVGEGSNFIVMNFSCRKKHTMSTHKLLLLLPAPHRIYIVQEFFIFPKQSSNTQSAEKGRQVSFHPKKKERRRRSCAQRANIKFLLLYAEQNTERNLCGNNLTKCS
jgi:hypothetical protein